MVWCIPQVVSSGAMTIVAGTLGRSGRDGDGFAATSATLSSPGTLLFDNTGAMIIMDVGNSVVRKVTEFRWPTNVTK